MDLKGKIAIVTGSAQGLGSAIARHLCASGACVTIVGRNDEAGEMLARELEHSRPGAALFCRTDIEQDEEIDRCVEATVARFGRLDILVNNACVYVDRGLESTRAEWQQTLGVNVVSAAVFAQKAAERMKRGGVVVNMGSVAGKFGAANRGPYPVSKAALLHLTRMLAVTLAPRGIRVVSVSPAWSWSPALSEFAGGSRARADAVGAAFHPLGRVADSHEIANAVAFVVSDAASWITGADIPVDGGFSALGPDQGIPPKQWFSSEEGAVPASLTAPR